MQETIMDVTQTMSLFLEAIAAVSLLVGAVSLAGDGIGNRTRAPSGNILSIPSNIRAIKQNTMFTSVLEKTKEIGIMKSIGAKNGDIMMIFLLNSAIIGLV